MGSISHSIRVLLDRSDTAKERVQFQGSSSNAGEDDQKKQGAQVGQFLDESDKESVGSDSEAASFDESKLPGVVLKHRDQFPEHLQEFRSECSRAVRRGRWPMPPEFASSPLPAPFEPKDCSVEVVKGNKNRNEIRDVCKMKSLFLGVCFLFVKKSLFLV